LIKVACAQDRRNDAAAAIKSFGCKRWKKEEEEEED